MQQAHGHTIGMQVDQFRKLAQLKALQAKATPLNIIIMKVKNITTV